MRLLAKSNWKRHASQPLIGDPLVLGERQPLRPLAHPGAPAESSYNELPGSRYTCRTQASLGNPNWKRHALQPLIGHPLVLG
jgi:hypothetical protein